MELLSNPIAHQHLGRLSLDHFQGPLLHLELALHHGAHVVAVQQDLALGRDKGLNAALLDRLELTDARIDGMIEGLQQVAALADPAHKKIFVTHL